MIFVRINVFSYNEADLTTTMSKSTKQCLTLNQIDSTELTCNDYYAAILVCCRFCKLPAVWANILSQRLNPLLTSTNSLRHCPQINSAMNVCKLY